MKFKLLVFDWDGTLMDSEARIVDCVQAALADLDLPARPYEEISNIIGLGLREAVTTLYPGADDALLQNIVNRYRRHYFDENRTPSPLFTGAREVIETLASRDYLLAVATGKGRKGLNIVLEATNLKEYFHATRCADEAFSKPHPEMLEQILDELGVFPHEALMIGDTEYDLQMAAHAGLSSLAVSYGVHGVERLLRHKPLACLAAVTEIPPWLQRQEQASVAAD
ncbi:MAG: HAD-IA family hydrolase [Chromatiales bacterium]|jgi:phosphoglycolate phosphatase